MKYFVLFFCIVLSVYTTSCSNDDNYRKVSGHVPYFNNGMNIVEVEKNGKIPFLHRTPGRDNPYMRYLGRWKDIIASIEELEGCEMSKGVFKNRMIV